MDWSNAKELIEQRLQPGTSINTSQSHHRKVATVGKEGLVVTIGWSELQDQDPVEHASGLLRSPVTAPEGYTGKFFRQHFSRQAAHHPCYVHVVRADICCPEGSTFRSGSISP